MGMCIRITLKHLEVCMGKVRAMSVLNMAAEQQGNDPSQYLPRHPLQLHNGLTSIRGVHHHLGPGVPSTMLQRH